jgi:hypothetical protein
MALSETELIERDLGRDSWQEALDAVRIIEAGSGGRRNTERSGNSPASSDDSPSPDSPVRKVLTTLDSGASWVHLRCCEELPLRRSARVPATEFSNRRTPIRSFFSAPFGPKVLFFRLILFLARFRSHNRLERMAAPAIQYVRPPTGDIRGSTLSDERRPATLASGLPSATFYLSRLETPRNPVYAVPADV